MGEFRIGTAISEPAAGNLKVGITNIQEIYLGTNKIWPSSVDPNVDPYVPVTPSAFRVLGRDYVTASNQSFALYDEAWNVITPTDGNGNTISFGSLNSLNYSSRISFSSSDNHQYIALLGINAQSQDYPSISTDYGQTFTKKTTWPRGNGNIKISKSGRVILYYSSANFGNGSYYISNDYGATVFQPNLPGLTPPYSGGSAFNSSMSGGGKYILLWHLSNPELIFLSNDYGQTFSDITSLVIGIGGISGFDGNMGVSLDGSKMKFITNSPSTGNYYEVFSSDFGQTTSLTGLGYNFTNPNLPYGPVHLDYTGSRSAGNWSQGPYVISPQPRYKTSLVGTGRTDGGSMSNYGKYYFDTFAFGNDAFYNNFFLNSQNWTITSSSKPSSNILAYFVNIQ